MNAIIINLSFTLLLAFPTLRLIGFYFSVYTNHMLDISSKRDVSQEKKRLFLYSLAIPILFLLRNILLESTEHQSTLWNLLVIASMASIILVAIGLHLIWTPMFRKAELKLIKEIAIKASNNSNYTIIDNELKINNVLENLSGDYLNCPKDSFLCLLSKKPLNDLPKIKWENRSRTKNTKANQRTLVVFICKLFPNRKNDDRFIEKTISDYFCDTEGNEIGITSQAINTNKKIIDNPDSASLNVKELISKLNNSLF